ncbi:hypothetical protein JCM6882_007763 [Rhodosporidiobolus microsporus]
MPPSASTSAATPSTGSSSDAARLRSLKAGVLTEHFRFAPETFAKGGMDLANRSMYAATAKVEQSLQKLVEDGVDGFEEDEVQRGIYRLETLLEDAIDTQFDLFEIFVLRNTFSFANDLLPYVTLPHQAALDPALRASDAPTLEEYEQELEAYEAELQKARELAAAEVFVKAKAAKVREQAELVGYLKQPGKLPAASSGPDSRIPILSAQLTSLLSHLSTLTSTASPSSSSSATTTKSKSAGAGGAGDDEGTPAWAASRAAFINWAAGQKAVPAAVARAVEAGGGDEGDAAVGVLQRRAEETGSVGEAKALLSALGR